MKTATNKDPDKTPVASDVFTYCTKEKTDTWHVVMAQNSFGVVERVKCKACASEHKYKRQNPLFAKPVAVSKTVRKVGQTSLSRATREKSSSSDAQLEEVWLAGLKKWGSKDVASFTPEKVYVVGEVFEHGSFGKGVVQTRRENKVDVLFQTGLKTLPSKMRA